MPKITVNGTEFEVPEGYTVLQASQMMDTEIPVFCYHPRLAIAGNCRMCLVEIEGSPKPVASCAMPVAEGMVIKTKTEKVQKARKGVLEFLLINHPLDCPICDQGGECDLQDITMAYGPGESRYDQPKRSVSDKYMGPIVKTFMTRCIHCTRCVRFATDIAGVPEMGAVGRGEHTEIMTYMDKAIESELSGNLVDVCPVGALTSRPYSYKGRPWELVKTDSIDVTDAVGSNIRFFTSGQRIMRVLPRLHEGVNEEWIGDKTRFAFEGLGVQRLDRPYVRKNGKLQESSWSEALKVAAQRLTTANKKAVAAFVGPMADCESILVLKELMHSLGVTNLDCATDGAFSPTFRAGYTFNTTIAGIEEADACFIIGANVRQDATMIHARLRKRFLAGDFPVAYVGGALPQDRDFTFKYDNLGTDPGVLEEILKGKHAFSKVLKKAKKPMIILGQSALTRDDGKGLHEIAATIADTYGCIQKEWNGFNVLHRYASRVGALDLGFVPGKGGQGTKNILKACDQGTVDVVYLLGEDTLDFTKCKKKPFVIYQGHHGTNGAHQADVIFPGLAYSEKNGTYVNTEGRVQQTWCAVQGPVLALSDWHILSQLSTYCGKPLPYETLENVQDKLAKVNKVFQNYDQIHASPWDDEPTKYKLSSVSFAPEVFDYYQADVISAHSTTLAKCAQELGSSCAQKEAVCG